MTKVFVYGTLKKGRHNHSWLQNSFCIGKCILAGYEIRAGRLPYAIQSDNEDARIEGELYEINHRVLEDLDILEGHPNFYKRVWVTTSKGKAWVYLYQDAKFARALPIVESW